jgi:hypothetical protein
MFRHVVMFRFADHVADDHSGRLAAGLAALPAKIPEIIGYRHGPDLGINEGNYDYVVVADFASADDFLTYRGHPDHLALIADYITDAVTERAAVQYEVSD